MGTDQTGRQQARSRTDKKDTHLDKKTNIWTREKAKIADVIKQVKRRKWTRQ